MRALVTAFVAGFMLVLLYERIYIKVKDEVIKEELRKDRVAPLQEVLAQAWTSLLQESSLRVHLKMNPIHSEELLRLKQVWVLQFPAFLPGSRKTFEGAESEGDGNTATAPKLEPAKDAKVQDQGTVAKAANIALDNPPLIAGHSGEK